MKSVSSWKNAVGVLSDDQLLERAALHLSSEREHAAWLVAHLAEAYRRDLTLKRGYASLFKYARQELNLTDAQAWERVSAAKLALQIPETIERLAKGELTLASAAELWKAFRDVERARLETQAALQGWRSERTGAPAPATPKVRATEITIALTDDELARFDRLRDRFIPAPVRREVWIRGQNRCEFIDPASGRRTSRRAPRNRVPRIGHAAPANPGVAPTQAPSSPATPRATYTAPTTITMRAL